MKRISPPFEAELTRQLADRESWRMMFGTSADGRTPCVAILCGVEAWKAAKLFRDRRIFVLLPPGAEPESFDWRALKGHSPVLVTQHGDVEGEIIQRLVIEIMRVGVSEVVCVGKSGTAVYRRGHDES